MPTSTLSGEAERPQVAGAVIEAEVVMGLAHVITVLHYGEVLADGTPTEIQVNPRVQEVYLKT